MTLISRSREKIKNHLQKPQGILKVNTRIFLTATVRLMMSLPRLQGKQEWILKDTPTADRAETVSLFRRLLKLSLMQTAAVSIMRLFTSLASLGLLIMSRNTKTCRPLFEIGMSATRAQIILTLLLTLISIHILRLRGQRQEPRRLTSLPTTLYLVFSLQMRALSSLQSGLVTTKPRLKRKVLLKQSQISSSLLLRKLKV